MFVINLVLIRELNGVRDSLFIGKWNDIMGSNKLISNWD